MPALTAGEIETGRRDQLLRAARKVFASKGYDRATIADVVREAGVAQGTFYLYFPSKKTILVTLAQDFRTALLNALFDPAISELPDGERGRAMVRAAFRVSRANPDLIRALHMGIDVEDLAQHAADGGPSVVERITALFREQVSAESMAPMDRDIVAKMICRLVEWASLECFVFGDGGDAQQYEDTLVEMIDRILKNSS